MKIKIALLLCIVFSAYSERLQAIPAVETDTLSIWVNGACGMCLTRIEDAALKVKGVESATWDLETHRLTLSIDPEKFKENKLHYKIASVGHDTEELLAPDPVYEALPACCKYRDPENSHFQETSGNQVSGYVFETGEQGEKVPLLGANVYWAGTSRGTITGEDGYFTIAPEEGAHMLVVSYVGYENDTMHIHEAAEVEVEFSRTLALEEVRVVHRIKPTSISFSSAYKHLLLTINEIC